jgi:hypothetical protein
MRCPKSNMAFKLKDKMKRCDTARGGCDQAAGIGERCRYRHIAHQVTRLSREMPEALRSHVIVHVSSGYRR